MKAAVLSLPNHCHYARLQVDGEGYYTACGINYPRSSTNSLASVTCPACLERPQLRVQPNEDVDTLKYVRPQIKACELAIGALERERRAKFAVGNAAYAAGVRGDVLEGEVGGAPFQWVEADRKGYLEYSEAIRELEDTIEILEDAR